MEQRWSHNAATHTNTVTTVSDQHSTEYNGVLQLVATYGGDRTAVPATEATDKSPESGEKRRRAARTGHFGQTSN